MITVKNEVDTLENGAYSYTVKKEKLTVKSHETNDNFIVLSFGEVEIVVITKDLKAAIENAANTAKY